MNSRMADANSALAPSLAEMQAQLLLQLDLALQNAERERTRSHKLQDEARELREGWEGEEGGGGGGLPKMHMLCNSTVTSHVLEA